MAKKESNVVLNFKMDGQIEYAKTIRDINAIMNAAASEYKTHVAAMGKDAEQTSKLAAEKKKLEIQMKAAKKRTEMLRTEYDAMANSSKTTTGQLAAKHQQIMNSERAEIALGDALDRVNEGLSEQAEESRRAQEEMNLLETQSDRLETQTEKLNVEYELQSLTLGENADESEKLALKIAHLNDVHEIAKDKVENYEQQLEIAKEQYGENSAEADKYETQLIEAQIAEQKLANEIDATNNKLNEQVDQLVKTSKELKDLGGKLKDLGTDMSDIGKELSLKVTAPVVGLAGALVKTGVEYKAFKEEAKQAFTVLLGSAEAAEEHMDRIMDFAKTTPFAFPDLVSANRKLVSFGMEAEATQPVMEAIANAVAAMGGGAQEIDTLSDVFAKIHSGGKITGEELNRFSDQGINALAILANSADVSMEEMRKQISAGSIDSEKAIDTLVDGIMNGSDGIVGETAKLGGSLEALEGTWKGAIDSMKGAWRRAGDAIVSDDMFNKMTESVGKLTEIINKLPEIIGPVADTLGTMMISLIDHLSALADWFLALDPSMQQLAVKFGLAVVAAGPLLLILGKIISIGGSIVSTVGTIIGVFGKLAPAIKIVGGFLTGLSAPVWGVIAAVAALIAIGVALWKNWDTIAEKAVNFKDTVVEKFIELKEATIEKITELISMAVESFTEFKDMIVEKFQEITENITVFFTEIIPNAFMTLVEFLQEIPTIIMEFLTQLFVEDIPYAVGFGMGWMVNTISEGVASAIEFFQAMPGRILEFLTEAIVNVMEWATNMKSKAVETGTQFLSTIVQFFQQLPGRIASFLATVISNVVRWVSNMKSKAIEVGTQFLATIIRFFQQLPGKMWSHLTQAITKVVTFARDIKEKAKEAGKNIFDGIVDEVKEIPGKLMSLGGDIIDGLVSGITGSVKKVTDIAKTIASKFTNGFKKAMGIASPSKVMAALAKWLPAGIGVGVEDNADLAIDKVKNVATSISRTVEDGLHLPDLEFGTAIKQPSSFRAQQSSTMLDFGPLNNIGASIRESLEGIAGNIVVQVYLDTKQLNTQLAPGMSQQLNNMNKFNARSKGVIIV